MAAYVCRRENQKILRHSSHQIHCVHVCVCLCARVCVLLWPVVGYLPIAAKWHVFCVFCTCNFLHFHVHISWTVFFYLGVYWSSLSDSLHKTAANQETWIGRWICFVEKIVWRPSKPYHRNLHGNRSRGKMSKYFILQASISWNSSNTQQRPHRLHAFQHMFTLGYLKLKLGPVKS